MKSMLTVFKEMLGLIAIAILVGASAQVVLPNGIGLRTELITVGTDSSEVTIPAVNVNPNGDPESAANISLSDAFLEFQSGTALFFDARDPEEFSKGHIKGAINLPVQAFLDSLPFLEDLNQDIVLITYCDGADCNASIDLAADLKMMGFAKVYFFFGGWQEWVEANYPLEKSTE